MRARGSLAVLIIPISKAWQVFVLDDSPARLRWFANRLPSALLCRARDDALQVLAANRFDVVFLDHDLRFMDPAYAGRLHGDGLEVARFLARTQFSGKVVIHSVSEPGTQALKKLLPNAVVHPFGSFNIRLEPERLGRQNA
jgi:CheY-like chemotaxis protein